MSAKLEDIVSLCKRRGFIYQGSDVYGGLSGTWDYGPLGVALKRNIQKEWLKTFVDSRDDMFQVDAAILMNQKVWQASGHVDTFTDPLVECSNCKGRFRADHLEGEKCPTCGKTGTFGEAKQFNMMFETVVGPASKATAKELLYDVEFDEEGNPHTFKGMRITNENMNEITMDFQKRIYSHILDSEDGKAYLRPETAQGIFTNYKNVVDSFYPNIPFGIAQIGKAFRNEISPRDFVFRSREFEQMEVEYFVDPEKWEESFENWRKDIHEFLEKLGLQKEKIHELEVEESDRAHYSKRTIDFEYDFPHKKDELLGLAYRTDFDLSNIARESGKNMEYRPKDGSKPYVPHVIEPSFGVERMLMAVLSSAYTEDEVEGEKRVYLNLPENLAPIRYAVCPLARNKEELVAKARGIYEALKKKHDNILWIDSGNIGKNYRKMDEIGVPEVITVDFETLEDNAVTVRERNTTKQSRIKISELV